MLLIGFVLSLVFLRQRRREGLLLPFVFIFLGAASNLFDRLYFGGVIDYIVLPFGGAVNLADVMIAIGLILILEIRN
jgi:lipoprotein signal peptidase